MQEQIRLCWLDELERIAALLAEAAVLPKERIGVNGPQPILGRSVACTTVCRRQRIELQPERLLPDVVGNESNSNARGLALKNAANSDGQNILDVLRKRECRRGHEFLSFRLEFAVDSSSAFSQASRGDAKIHGANDECESCRQSAQSAECRDEEESRPLEACVEADVGVQQIQTSSDQESQSESGKNRQLEVREVVGVAEVQEQLGERRVDDYGRDESRDRNRTQGGRDEQHDECRCCSSQPTVRREEVRADRQSDEETEHGSGDKRTAEVIADHIMAECGIDDDGIENTDHRRGEYAKRNVGSVLQLIVLFCFDLGSV